MKNETKLGIFILSVLLVTFCFGWAFNLSLNPKTFQIGYTLYSSAGEKVQGFIPNTMARSDANCERPCEEKEMSFAGQCRGQGYKVYNGPCCQTLCSGNVASTNGGHEL